MAGFTPFIQLAVSTAGNLHQQNVRNKLQNAALEQSRLDTNRNYIAAERQRQERLARAQAAQRAGFAAAGISNDGSGAAVLTSLLTESEAERDQLTQAYQSRLSNLELTGRVNLLRQRQQLFNSGLALSRRLPLD